MLQKLRLSSYLYGRTLLGMLLLVWLSMAISPCIMANELNPDAVNEQSSLHTAMADCSYCPSENNSSALELCSLTQSHFDDSLMFNIDTIDVDSYICFEIPIAATILIPEIQYFSYIDYQTNFYRLSPLSLTGILRI